MSAQRRRIEQYRIQCLVYVMNSTFISEYSARGAIVCGRRRFVWPTSCGDCFRNKQREKKHCEIDPFIVSITISNTLTLCLCPEMCLHFPAKWTANNKQNCGLSGMFMAHTIRFREHSSTHIRTDRRTAGLFRLHLLLSHSLIRSTAAKDKTLLRIYSTKSAECKCTRTEGRQLEEQRKNATQNWMRNSRVQAEYVKCMETVKFNLP